MAISNRYYEYSTDRYWAHYYPVQDFFFFIPAARTSGGGMSVTSEVRTRYDGVTYNRLYPELLVMKDGARLGIGGNDNSAPQLYYKGINTQLEAMAVSYTASGTIDFANATGEGAREIVNGVVVGIVQEIVPIRITVENVQNRLVNYAAIEDEAPYIKGTQTVNSYIVKAAGNLKVAGDMNAILTVSTHDTLIGSYAYVKDGKRVVTNLASNNTIYSAAYRTGSLTIAKDFNGAIYSSVLDVGIMPRSTGTVSGNKIGSHGIWSDGAVNIGAWNGGVIDAVTSGVGVGVLISHLELDDKGNPVGAGSVSLSNNAIFSYGIRAGAITLGNVGEYVWNKTTGKFVWVDGGSISTDLNNLVLYGRSGWADGKDTITISGNTFSSIAIYGSSLSVGSYFEATLTSSMSSLASYMRGSRMTWASNAVELYGIKVSGTLSAAGNFGGVITLNYSNDNQPVDPNASGSPISLYLNAADFAGVYAPTINIGSGLMTSTITVDVKNLAPHSYLDISKTIYGTIISGIETSNFTAEAFSGSITVDGSYDLSTLDYNAMTVGILVKNGFSNSNDKVFDITGDIIVDNGYRCIGIMGGKNGFDFRVSGSIITGDSLAQSYAIVAGLFDSNGSSIALTDKNDRVEFAAGARIVGNIDLGNGKDTVTIDSNSRVTGDLTAKGTAGRLNIEYVLNATPFDSDLKLSGTPIVTAMTNAPLSSTAEVTVNMNTVELGSYILYEGKVANMSDWRTMIINFKYQGINKEMQDRENLTAHLYGPLGMESYCMIADKGITGKIAADGGRCVIDSGDGRTFLEITSSIVNNRVIFTVATLPPTPATPLKDLKGFTTTYNRNTRTVTVGWTDDDGSTAESYELEYRINTKDDNGTVISTGRTIIQTIKGKNGASSVTLKNIDHNQEVEWRVRQTLGGYDSVGSWSKVFSTDDVKGTEKTLTLAPVVNAVFELGQSADSAVSELTWDAPVTSEGVDKYRVRYFQSMTYYDDKNKIDWSKQGYMTKEVTNNRILIGGLQNTEYFYWQVQYVDMAGNVSEWGDGTLFKVYVDDVNPPTFESPVVSTTKWSYAAGDLNPSKILLPTLTWDPAIDDRAGVSQYLIEYYDVNNPNNRGEAVIYHEEGKVSYIWNDPNTGTPLVLANGNYHWEIKASDYVGNISTPVEGKQAGTWYGDFTAPVFQTSKVISTTAWNDPGTNIKVTQSWEAAVDNVGGSGVCRYELKYRAVDSTAAWKTITISATSTNWTGYVANGDYDYTLSAFDAGGNQSSIKSGVWLGDLNGPTFASDTAVATNDYNVNTRKSTVKFSWAAATDRSVDGRPVSGLSHYIVSYRGPDGKTNSITVKSGNSYTLPSSVTLEEGTYSWTVTAYDKAGNSTALTGNSFYIDTGAPTGKFNYVNTPVITVVWNEGTTTTTNEDGTTSDIVVVRTIHSAKVAFSWNDTYTDPSGVVYTIQFSDSKNFSGKNTYSMLSYVENGSSFTIGNGMPTIPVGIFENMDTVYWRVMAQDTLGNATGIWSATQSFKFIDPETDTKITSSVKPQKAYDILITQTKGENGVYDGSLKYDWYVKSSELGIAELDYVFASKDGGDNYQFTYGYGSVRPDDPTNDSIGFSHIYGYLYNPNRSDGSLADGTYTWTIVTRDTKGRTTKSDKYSFVLDTTAPTTVTGIGVTTLVRDALVYWNASTDRFGIDGYQLQYRLKGTSTWHIANTTLTTDTNYWFTDLSNGTYEMVVYAIDKNGNRSASSGIKEFSLDSSDDLPNDMNAAKSFDTYAKNGIVTNTIGMSDVYDCFYFDATKSGNLTLSVRDLQSVYGKGGAITIEVYQINPSTYRYELVKKYSYKKVGYNQLLLNMPYGQKYYVAISNQKGEAITKYDLAMTYEKFDSNNENDYWQSLPAKYTIGNHGTNTGLDTWIGYGDLIDYFKVNTASGPGTYNVNISGLSGKVKLTLYQTTVKNGVTKLKKMKSITITPKRDKAGNIVDRSAGALINQLVGDPDVTYYIAVEAPSGKKGVNSNYKLNYDSTQLFTRANQANDNNWATAPVLSCQPGSKISGEWVGFGDKIDYRKLNVTVAGAFDFAISGVQNSLKMTIYVQNGDKLKKLKTVTVNPSKGVAEISNLLLQKGGAYYISIEAPKAAKGVNSDYNVNITGQLFNNQYNSLRNNYWGDSAVGTIDLAKGVKGEWVGYGDAYDWFKFDVSAAGSYNFDFRLDVEKAAKMTLYSYDSITGQLRKVKVDSFGNADLTAGQQYAVEIVSADKGKGKKNTGYDLSIAMQAVSNSDPLFSSSGKIDDWEDVSKKQGVLA